MENLGKILQKVVTGKSLNCMSFMALIDILGIIIFHYDKKKNKNVHRISKGFHKGAARANQKGARCSTLLFCSRSFPKSHAVCSGYALFDFQSEII